MTTNDETKSIQYQYKTIVDPSRTLAQIFAHVQ